MNEHFFFLIYFEKATVNVGLGGHVEENIIKPMMPDKVVESFRRNIWEDERELEGNLELGFTMYTYESKQTRLCGSLSQVNGSICSQYLLRLLRIFLIFYFLFFIFRLEYSLAFSFKHGNGTPH